MSEHIYIKEFCTIRNNNVFLNGNSVFSNPEVYEAKQFLKNCYQHFKINYPKFFKMDTLSKLGFLASEVLIGNCTKAKPFDIEKTALVLSNSSSSLDTDFPYNDTINDITNYFPSPAVFVYTLPNIMIGEICIRNNFRGENVFFVNEKFDPMLITSNVKNIFSYTDMQMCITGWVEIFQNKYDVFMCMVEKGKDSEDEDKNCIFDAANIFDLYTK